MKVRKLGYFSLMENQWARAFIDAQESPFYSSINGTSEGEQEKGMEVTQRKV